MIIDDSTWEYWLILSKWSRLEAAFLLDGIIPNDDNLRDYGIGLGSDESFCLEPSCEALYKFIKREIPSEAVLSPKAFLEWALEKNLELPLKLTDAINASQMKLISNNLEKTTSEESNGSHWAKKRESVLALALSFISSPPAEFSRNMFFHDDGSIHINKLAEAIDDYRQMLWKDGSGLKIDAIRMAISNAINQKNKK